jgi:hypothetical protein
MKRIRYSPLLLALLAPLPGGAQVPLPPADNTNPPAPTDDEIRRLIIQLGSEDFAQREAAAKRLQRIGKAALPHLKAAQGSPDAEVASRARLLVTRMEIRPVPGPNPNHAPGVDRSSARVSVDGNGNRITDISEGGRRIKILQGADGISMTVSGWVEGQPATEEYTAPSPEILHEQNPEAFRLFDQWSGRHGIGPGGMLQPRIRLEAGALVVGPPAGPQEVDLLRLRLERQMREKRVADAARDQVDAALDKLAEARDVGGMDEYLARSDELHTLLDKQKLEAGELLPPPAKTRLGVSISETEEGMTVQRVSEKSRAQRLGLKPLDLIRKVDGKEVADVAQLRKAVGANEKGLVVEIRRGDESLKLEEKPDDATK